MRNGGRIGKVVDVRLFIVYEMVWRHSNGCAEARELTMCGNVMGQLVEIFDCWSTMTLNETKKPGAAVGMSRRIKATKTTHSSDLIATENARWPG